MGLVLKIRSYILFWSTGALAGTLLLHRGDAHQAIEVSYLNLYFMNGAFLRFNQTVVDAVIDSAASSLTEQEIEAAKKRGESLDLWKTAEGLLAQFSE